MASPVTSERSAPAPLPPAPAGETAAHLAPQARRTAPPFDLDRVRADFPILGTEIHGHRLVYLDSAASAQKPRAVIEAISACLTGAYANVHRGVHTLSQRATDLYEGVRQRVQRFLNAPAAEEIVFVRGTTEALNLVAQSYGRSRLGPGDEVLITELEHHSNLVPWQRLCAERGAVLQVAPIDDRGEVILEEYARRLSERTRIVALAHVSNALGTVLPIARMAELAHAAGAVVVVDGAQSAPHLPVDVQALGCDFFAFSGHKVCGPSGIGALWGRAELLAAMPPWQSGGGMIRSVRFAGTEYAPPPARFEAGTPAIEAAAGLTAALDYLDDVGRERIAAWEEALLAHAVERLEALPGLRRIGTAPERAAVLSFTLAGVHPHDVGTILDRRGIAIRAGHHCAQPVMERFGVPATARASFAFYNTLDEVDALAEALAAVRELFG
ncbi:MAG TPA: cysteine desulfurase [Thermoanaerobaculia bacterium]|nr:cysteine desulfurase [Thermoanaerobaculia bacterium]